jgi:hypothetical protein
VEFKGQPNVEELSSQLKGETPRCAVIVSAAYFDETLARMVGDTQERSFFSRINDALVWTLLAPSEHKDLHAIRELRNCFAHDPRVRDFDAGVLPAGVQKRASPVPWLEVRQRTLTDSWWRSAHAEGPWVAAVPADGRQSAIKLWAISGNGTKEFFREAARG